MSTIKEKVLNKVQSFSKQVIDRVSPEVQNEVRRVVTNTRKHISDNIYTIAPMLMLGYFLLDTKQVHKVAKSVLPLPANDGATVIYNITNTVYNYYTHP